MKIKRDNQKNTRKIIVIVAITLLLVGAGLSGLHLYLNSRQAGPTEAQEKERDQQYANDKKEFLDKVESEKNKENSTKENPSFTNPSESISLDITNTSDQVTIKSNLLGLSSGVCRLAIEGTSKSLSKEAPVIYARDFSTCAGFTINRSEIDGPTWKIIVSVTANEKTIMKEHSYTLK